MFENVLYQNAVKNLASNLHNNMLPNSILFSGPASSGKLTCALELARVLSCQGNGKVRGDWNCTCPSCLKNKALVSQNLLITGPKNCFLEIAASRETFLSALTQNKPYLQAANYLFVRSVRKLTSRFNPVFYEGEDNIQKISALIQPIDQILEDLDPLKISEQYKNGKIDVEQITKLADELLFLCEKLETSSMKASILISHIRNASKWAQYTAVEGKKVLIIENADKMNDSSRNALLKILEEPPENMIFILTTERKSAIMPTILSRVRNYTFSERSIEQESTVIERIFHSEKKCSINEYLYEYLPVGKEKLEDLSEKFLESINNSRLLDFEELSKEANDFKPLVLFQMFLEKLFENGKKRIRTEGYQRQNILYGEKQIFLLKKVQECYESVTIYNQTPSRALQKLAGDLL